VREVWLAILGLIAAVVVAVVICLLVLGSYS
jgi:hypothetical protein